MGLLLADAHVHLYDCFDPKLFFDAAYANFGAHARRVGQPERFAALLLLSEADGCNWFQRLAGGVGQTGRRATVPGWTLETTDESCSLSARSDDGRELIVIAGHQIVTAERLEVLALCCEARPAGDLPLVETLRCTAELGGIPVVAWGAGKWLGSRGAAVRRLLRERPVREVFLGDNGGRLAVWPRPAAFRVAERLGIRVLPGSDPLPFPSHTSRAGSFGFWSPADLSRRHPGRSLKQLVRDPLFVPHPYGALARPVGFFLDQAAMQLRARSR